MSIMGVLLLLIGAAILTAGYLIPAGKNGYSGKLSQNQEQQIREFFESEMEGAREKINDIVDETVSYSVEKTERSMERLSNEKIMAINEYSDTVLQEIHKNHEEAVFLYDMLNNKHDTFMTTVSEAGKTITEVKQTLQDAQVTAKEAFVPIQAAEIEDMDSVLKVPEYTENDSAEEMLSDEEDEFSSPDMQLLHMNASNGNNNDRILEMHHAGKSNVAIAKELGLGVGEVKLVIDLYKGVGGQERGI